MPNIWLIWPRNVSLHTVRHCTHHCKFSHYTWGRPSRGTRSVDRRTSLALWPCRGRCHSHTCPSHCRSCHQVSCSGAGTTLWTAYTHHPPGWEKERRSVVIQLWKLLRLRVKCVATCVCLKSKIPHLSENTFCRQVADMPTLVRIALVHIHSSNPFIFLLWTYID